MADGFSHLDEHGRATMVDVGDKQATARVARAAVAVRMSAATLKMWTTAAETYGTLIKELGLGEKN